MRIRYALFLLGLACADNASAPVDLGAARVVIESVTTDELRYRVTVTLRNDGGGGAFYVEIAGATNTPGGSGPVARSESVGVNADYRETITYDVTFTASLVRVYSRADNSASYTRTGCYYISTQERC